MFRYIFPCKAWIPISESRNKNDGKILRVKDVEESLKTVARGTWFKKSKAYKIRQYLFLTSITAKKSNKSNPQCILISNVKTKIT